eukprot:TRINITY_DN11732_c0_g1_i5.p1 TRINITY_DN11732_c0_g1~~TRINITY_DN11732_c0_g1_i5.p1  ORF type:complete len:238 (+),score=14.51 TRINITY_DN11732_c0_g1_i5:706-1419(+)
MVVKEKYLIWINESVLVLNMICYFVGTLTVYLIVQFYTLQEKVFEFLSFMLLPSISLLQIILILTKYINDTSKELAESNDHETMMIELTKLYSSSELRIREYETVKERSTNHKFTKPSYADLFTGKYIKRTIEGLGMLTLRGLCGFAVTRFFLSAIFKGMFAEILCISLIIAGALIAFFLINSNVLQSDRIREEAFVGNRVDGCCLSQRYHFSPHKVHRHLQTARTQHRQLHWSRHR